MDEYDSAIARANTYLNDVKVKDRLENSEYNRLVNKAKIRNLKLHKRVENTRNDTLEDIIKRSAY